MTKAKRVAGVGPAALIDWKGVPASRLDFEAGSTIFAQGDPATTVMYVEGATCGCRSCPHRQGSRDRRARPGHFFGEGCLAGQPQRMATATAMGACTVLAIDKPTMVPPVARPTRRSRIDS